MIVAIVIKMAIYLLMVFNHRVPRTLYNIQFKNVPVMNQEPASQVFVIYLFQTSLLLKISFDQAPVVILAHCGPCQGTV